MYPLNTLAKKLLLIPACGHVARIVPGAILSTVTSLVTTIFSLYSSIGFYKTFQILLRIRNATKFTIGLTTLKDILFKGTNPVAAEAVYKILASDWVKIIKYLPSFQSVISIILCVFAIILFLQPLFIWLIRVSFTLVLSAIGILYTPALRAVKFLKKYSAFVLGFLPFDLIPKDVKNVFSPVTEIINEPIAESKIKKVGLAILAAFGLILL